MSLCYNTGNFVTFYTQEGKIKLCQIFNVHITRQTKKLVFNLALFITDDNNNMFFNGSVHQGSLTPVVYGHYVMQMICLSLNK